MTDKDKIREEVVGIINSINLFTPDEDGKNSSYEAGKLDAATQILQIIDSFEESVSEDMNDIALKYANEQLAKAGVTDKNCPREYAVAIGSVMFNAFKAGANWQKEQDKQLNNKEK